MRETGSRRDEVRAGEAPPEGLEDVELQTSTWLLHVVGLAQHLTQCCGYSYYYLTHPEVIHIVPRKHAQVRSCQHHFSVCKATQTSGRAAFSADPLHGS